jgi:hypothetical protein
MLAVVVSLVLFVLYVAELWRCRKAERERDELQSKYEVAVALAEALNAELEEDPKVVVRSA